MSKVYAHSLRQNRICWMVWDRQRLIKSLLVWWILSTSTFPQLALLYHHQYIPNIGPVVHMTQYAELPGRFRTTCRVTMRKSRTTNIQKAFMTTIASAIHFRKAIFEPSRDAKTINETTDVEKVTMDSEDGPFTVSNMCVIRRMRLKTVISLRMDWRGRVLRRWSYGPHLNPGKRRGDDSISNYSEFLASSILTAWT